MRQPIRPKSPACMLLQQHADIESDGFMKREEGRRTDEFRDTLKFLNFPRSDKGVILHLKLPEGAILQKKLPVGVILQISP